VSTFDDRARDWDDAERVERARVVAEAIRRVVPLTRTMRTIDLGAGTGLLGLALADDVGDLVLADPSEGMLAVTRDKLAANPRQGVSVVRLDLLADPPPGEPFDLAVSLLVLHHIADTAAGLRAVHDLLRPGGRIALADLDTEPGTFHDPGAEGIHHRGFDRASIAGLARDAGFVDVAVTTATEITREGLTYPLFLLLGRKP
jgi:ubiquinone/menaquinone biosynthesis C-methylase UbiE